MKITIPIVQFSLPNVSDYDILDSVIRERILQIRRGCSEMLRLSHHSNGQGLVEYALIIALVAIVVIGTLILLGPQIASIFQNISNNL
jgi:pilus assembly protein Flp/PilA